MDNISEFLPRQSSQKVADIRMILRAMIASRNSPNEINVIIQYTDVLVHLLHHRSIFVQVR